MDSKFEALNKPSIKKYNQFNMQNSQNKPYILANLDPVATWSLRGYKSKLAWRLDVDFGTLDGYTPNVGKTQNKRGKNAMEIPSPMEHWNTTE